MAKVLANNLVSKNVLHIGAPAGVEAATIDMIVHKFGRTTSYTVGRVSSIDTDVTVGSKSRSLWSGLREPRSAPPATPAL